MKKELKIAEETAQISIWRQQLSRHNAQPGKKVRYDEETGESQTT